MLQACHARKFSEKNWSVLGKIENYVTDLLNLNQ